jgi:hypothetical protein
VLAVFDPSFENEVNLLYRLNKSEVTKSQSPPRNPELDFRSGIFIRNIIPHVDFMNVITTDKSVDPLGQRAWALQERLISTRILHYTASELVWECKTSVTCQCGGINSQIHQKSFVDDPEFVDLQINFRTEFHRILQEQHTTQQMTDLWMSVVFHYANRCLTQDNDRLPALSGLAREFQLADLGIHEMIGWCSPAGAIIENRPASFTAPSWSWASVKSVIYFLPDFFIVGKVIKAYCVPAGLDPTGAVSEGLLVISGQFMEATIVVSDSKNRTPPGTRLPPLVVQSEIASFKKGYFRSDSLSDFDMSSPVHPVVCVLWSLKRLENIPGRMRMGEVESLWLVL